MTSDGRIKYHLGIHFGGTIAEGICYISHRDTIQQIPDHHSTGQSGFLNK